MTSPSASPSESSSPSAVERAIAFGVDVTLLIKNLRLTSTERVQRAQAMRKPKPGVNGRDNSE